MDMGEAFAIQFLPGDRELISGNSREFKLWDVSPTEPNDLQRASVEHRLLNLDYSPDGNLLACTAKDGVLRIFDAVSGALYHSFPSRRDPTGNHFPL